MKTAIFDLQICAAYMGYYNLPGFADAEEDIAFNEDAARERLISAGLLEETEDSNEPFIISALGEFYINNIANPDVWILINNKQSGIIRRLYIKDENYIVAEGNDNVLSVFQLPIITVAFGAVAGMLEPKFNMDAEAEAIITACGKSGDNALTFDIYSDGTISFEDSAGITKKEFNETDDTNLLVQWIISGLKDVEEA